MSVAPLPLQVQVQDTRNRKSDCKRWWRVAAAPDASADFGVRGDARQGVIRVLLHLRHLVLLWVWGILHRRRSHPCTAAHYVYFKPSG
jgi:hypothetical protein